MNNIEYLSQQISEINEKFKNSFLNRIQSLTNSDFLFGFSKGREDNLLISIFPNNPFIRVIKDKFLINLNSPFINRIKTKIYNSKFLEATLINNDNIIKLSFLKTNDLYEKINYDLYIELFKMNTNIILVNNGIVVEAFHFHGLDSKNPLILNAKFLLPNELPYIKDLKDSYEDDILKYINGIEKNYLKEKYKTLITSLSAKKKSLTRKIVKIKEDQNEANLNLLYKDYADYFLMNLEKYKKGTASFQYENKNIPIKENLNSEKNLEYLYKIYKKAKQTLIMSTDYLNKTQDELDYIISLLDQISFFNEDDFIELIKEIKSNNIVPIKNNIIIKKNSISSVKPYYIEVDGIKIGYGKNNIQNDFLTFSIAKKTDYFLHIDKTHGPHVVIFDSNPNNNIKEIASELAVYLAKNNGGDVIFTSIKNVKKMGQLGKVKVVNYETFLIKEFKHDIKNLLESSKRF